MSFEQIKERVVEYQERCFAAAGDCAEGLGWKSREAQHLLFRVIRSMGILQDSSILDVGCGLAHFYDFLIEQGYHGRYTGIDISAALIGQARTRLPEVDLRVTDILQDGIGDASYDFVVASGVFTTRFGTPIPEFERYIEEMIRRLYSTCRVGTIFNMLTSYVDYEVQDLYYADPARYLTLLKSLSRYVGLKHDYPAFFFTVGAYRSGNDYTAA